MDEGNFKTPDIDLAMMFLQPWPPAPAAGASGQASELAPSTADGSLPPAPAKTSARPLSVRPAGWCPVVCACAACPPWIDVSAASCRASRRRLSARGWAKAESGHRQAAACLLHQAVLMAFDLIVLAVASLVPGGALAFGSLMSIAWEVS